MKWISAFVLAMITIAMVGLLMPFTVRAEPSIGVIGPREDEIDLELARMKPDDTLPLAKAVHIAESRVNRLDSVGGFAGEGLGPTRFLKYSVVLIAGGTTNVPSFLRSTNPVVRAMGIVCLSQTDTNAFKVESHRMKNDRAELDVWTGCCCPFRMTLGELVKDISKDRNFLGHQGDYNDFQAFRKQVESGRVPVRVFLSRHWE